MNTPNNLSTQDTATFIDNVATQLSQVISKLSKADTNTADIIKVVLMGIYTQGYRDANIHRENKKYKNMEFFREQLEWNKFKEYSKNNKEE
jgi:hypothetical protein